MENIQMIKNKIKEIKAVEPKIRNRDLAGRLNISEAELLSLSTEKNVTRLSGSWSDLLISLKEMGYVMALTRNEACVHERKGIYDNINFYGGTHNMGVAVNSDIDLRFFMNEWHYGMAVEMTRGNSKLYSFQFFNKKGEAVHKVFSTPKSDIEVYHKLVKLYTASDQSPIIDVDESVSERPVMTPDNEIDIESFQSAWKGLKDTHDFFGMLKKYKLNRLQGLRLAPEGFTERVENESIKTALELAAEQATSIMCFVHSPGCIQIHTGPVKNLKMYGEWFNIMDAKFNLHLDMSAVSETWIVKKPTEDGIVTSLELFDKNGDLLVYFFGARKPGKPELESWRNIIKTIERRVLN